MLNSVFVKYQKKVYRALQKTEIHYDQDLNILKFDFLLS